MHNVVWFVVVALVACGGDDSVGPGDQSFNPAPEQEGSGRPSDATGVTCSAASDCGYWFCGCDDGAVVNSALCVNGYCMGAASACPRACEYFQHGGWTGDAGGGPDETQPAACGGLGSHNPVCDACGKSSCCDESESCGTSNDCLAYWDCAIPCNGDRACRAECDMQYPGGASPYRALESCLVDNCASACGG